MKKEDIIKILEENEWEPTDGIPKWFDGIDYHRHIISYNRIILFDYQIKEISEERLRYLMRTPVERRVY